MININSARVLIGICGLDVIYTKGIQSILGIEKAKDTYISNVQTEMIEMASRKRPDIIMIKDWEEPNDFVYVVQRIREVNPNTKFLVLISNIKSQKSLISVCESKVDAIIDKQSNSETITEALNILIKGETYISTNIATHLLNLVVDLLTYIKRQGDYIGIEVLTKREKEVFELMRKGYKNHEIASHLYISVNTVNNHVVSINKKLKLRNKREIINLDHFVKKTSTKPSLSRSSNQSGNSDLNRCLDQMGISSNAWIYDKRYNYDSKNRV